LNGPTLCRTVSGKLWGLEETSKGEERAHRQAHSGGKRHRVEKWFPKENNDQEVGEKGPKGKEKRHAERSFPFYKRKDLAVQYG